MQLSTVIFAMSLLAPLCAGHPSPDANAIADPGSADALSPLEARDGVLQKRQCKNNGCLCQQNTTQGQYCYGCDAVTYVGKTDAWDGDVTGWVFECNPDGGCCAYGTRISCKDGAQDPCGPS